MMDRQWKTGLAHLLEYNFGDFFLFAIRFSLGYSIRVVGEATADIAAPGSVSTLPLEAEDPGKRFLEALVRLEEILHLGANDFARHIVVVEHNVADRFSHDALPVRPAGPPDALQELVQESQPLYVRPQVRAITVFDLTMELR